MGVHVEGITETVVSSASDAAAVLEQGNRNRHIGETAMNRESSRSHAVFTLFIETFNREADGIQNHKQSRFSMVDLAGSERQRDTSATGERLKEAGVINKSLSALGNVIKALSERSRSADGAKAHIHYRDSKLTFLLRDSIGGNSKTVLIATISPSETSMAETLSTLQFAQRAKRIKNIAVVNVDVSGNIQALQREIVSLRAKLAEMASNPGAVVVSEPHFALESLVQPLSNEAYIDLPSQALVRCRMMEEEKTRVEEQNRILQDRISQQERVSLAFKMQLKMRDAEISRLRKGDGEPTTIDDLMKHELDTIREQMATEIQQQRTRADESERRFLVLQDKMSRGEPLWTQPMEELFHQKLIDSLESTEQKYNEMQDRLELLGSERFEEAFGFTLSEARNLRSTAEECHRRAQEAEVMLKITREECESKLARLSEALENAEKSGIVAHEELTDKNSKISHLEEIVRSMEREMRDKDEHMASVASASKQISDDERQGLLTKEFEHRKAMNKAMKDNAILIAINQRLEKDIASKNKAFDLQSSEMKQASTAHSDEIAALQSSLDTMTLELKDLRAGHDDLLRELSDVVASNASLEAENCEMEEKLRQMEDRITSLNQDISKLTFDLENANETNDNLYLQTEQLLAERLDFVAAVKEANDRCRLLEEALETANKEINSSKVLVEEVELLTQQISDAKTRTAEANSRAELIESSYQNALLELEAKNAEVAKSSMIINSLQQMLDESRFQLQSEEKSKEELASALHEIKEESLQLSRKLSAADNIVDSLKNELETLRINSSNLQSHLEDAENKNNDATALVAALQVENTDLQDQLSKEVMQKEAALAVCQAEISALKGQVRDLEMASQTAEEERLKAEVALTKAIEARDLRIFDFQKAHLANMRVEEIISERDALKLELQNLALQLKGRDAKLFEERRISDDLRNEVQILCAKIETLERDFLSQLEESKSQNIGLETEILSIRKSESELKIRQLTESWKDAQSTIVELTTKLEESERELSSAKLTFEENSRQLRQELQASQEEVARLCGQHNSKQRIQQHMKLKKELEDHAVLLKHQMAIIEELTHERDTAREDARKHRQMYKDAGLAINSVTETIVQSTKRRLSDSSNNSRKGGGSTGAELNL